MQALTGGHFNKAEIGSENFSWPPFQRTTNFSPRGSTRAASP
jgi:hypothetical protein